MVQVQYNSQDQVQVVNNAVVVVTDMVRCVAADFGNLCAATHHLLNGKQISKWLDLCFESLRFAELNSADRMWQKHPALVMPTRTCTTSTTPTSFLPGYPPVLGTLSGYRVDRPSTERSGCCERHILPCGSGSNSESESRGHLSPLS